MITITLTNMEVAEWPACEYDDYKYDGKYFLILRNNRWIGFYNLEHVISIVVKDE